MTDMPQSYHLLLVEDSADDAELILRGLRHAPFGYTHRRVETEQEFVAALADHAPDAVLCDYHLPRFDSQRALAILKERLPDTPLIMISHNIGEDAAVEALHNGASDYLLKNRLGRLASAIETAIGKGASRRANARAEEALRISELHKRAILNSLKMCIALLDKDGVVVATNPAWDSFAPAPAFSESAPRGVGDNYLAYLDSLSPRFPHAAHAAAGLRAVMARSDRAFALEYETSSQGASRWFVMRVLPIEDGTEGAVVSHEDVTDRILAHVALRNANARLQTLSSRVLTIQEEERRSISRELHDDIGQSLTALKIGLHMATNAADEERARRLGDCLATADATLDKLRQMSLDLHPPQLDQLGLDDALQWLVGREAGAMGIDVDYRCKGIARRLPRGLETACFRITQEALSNAARHAQAGKVVVQLELNGELLHLTIRDDGVGFDEQAARARALKKGSLGLISMEERADLAGGRLKIRSVPGGGTTIAATFPLLNASPDATEARP